MKWITRFCWIFVGVLFIFSGLIKINDPAGTAIKLEEYFEVFSEDFGSFFLSLKPLSLVLAVILNVLEIVLGVALLMRWHLKTVLNFLLALIIFFTFLTFYSAYFNKVTDCGCFGDAIKLTPWESFSKDIVLVLFILHLFWYRKGYQPVLRSREGHAVVIVTTLLCFYLGIYAIRHLPFIDFRAYKIGNNIPEQMQPPEQPKFEYVFKKKDTGEEIVSEKYLTDTLLYKYLSVRQTNEE